MVIAILILLLDIFNDFVFIFVLIKDNNNNSCNWNFYLVDFNLKTFFNLSK